MVPVSGVVMLKGRCVSRGHLDGLQCISVLWQLPHQPYSRYFVIYRVGTWAFRAGTVYVHSRYVCAFVNVTFT